MRKRVQFEHVKLEVSIGHQVTIPRRQQKCRYWYSREKLFVYRVQVKL